MAVRRESVVLDLQSNLPEGMLRGAVATEVLRKELDRLSGTSVQTSRVSQNISRDMDRVSSSAKKADQSINQLTGRLRVLGEVAAILGPTLAPLGGVALAGIGGLANQLGIAAVAGGVLIGSMQGLGDALSAMNDAALDPTDKNLEKAHDALKRLSPAAREFAKEAFALRPALAALRDLGAENLFPGLTEALESLQELGPRVGAIMESFGSVLGDIASDSAASLASERWADFFTFIETEGPATFSQLATTVGDLAHGLSELWMAFQPLNSDFSSWLMDVAAGFDEWASGLAQTEGFREFIEYVRTSGPQVADTFGAMFNAVVQLVQASAPLGGPVLAGLEAVAKVVGAIADSDLGTPIMAGVTALALLNRTLAATAALSKVSLSSGLFSGVGTVATGARSQATTVKALSGDLALLGRNFATAGAASQRMATQNAAALSNLKSTAATAGKGAAALGGLAVAGTGAADGLGLTNTASLALMGTVAGPWGAAIGGGIGLLLDWQANSQNAAAATSEFEQSLKAMTDAQLKQQSVLDETLAYRPGSEPDDAEGLAGQDRLDAINAELKARKELEAAELGRSRRAALAYASEVGMNADLAKWRYRSVEDIKAQAEAFAKAREAAMETAKSFVNLGDSLDDSKVSLKDWIAQMADSASALRNFMNNARTAAKRGLNEGLIASLQEAGEAGALRMRQLANATDEEIAKANRAWRRGQKAMEDYANFVVPPKKPKVDVSTPIAEIERLEAKLRNIRDENVNIVIRQIGATTLGPRNEAAGGTFVPKTGLPYADRHLYLLADGEGVTTNRRGETDRFKDVITGINAGYSRSMIKGMLADGGTVEKAKPGKKRKNEFSFADTSGLESVIERLTMVSEQQTRALEAATTAQDYWSQKMSDVAQATVAGFNTGLFDRGTRGSGGGGPIGNLAKDISGLQQRGALQSQLAGMGLNGNALAALLGEGTNADIAGLIASGQVAQYADMFAQRQSLQAQVGQQAGVGAFGSQYATAAADTAKQQKNADRLDRRMDVLTNEVRMLQSITAEVGPQVAGGVNSTASSASKHKGGKWKPKPVGR